MTNSRQRHGIKPVRILDEQVGIKPFFPILSGLAASGSAQRK